MPDTETAIHEEPHRLEPGPAGRFRHDHPFVNPIKEQQENLTLGQRLADAVAAVVGSWPFIVVQSILLMAWIVLNIWLAWHFKTHPEHPDAWDPYPFILLNLVLSFQAAYTGPVVMMSQNRQAEKDRITTQNDFNIDQTAEEEIRVIMEHLGHQDILLIEAIQAMEKRQSPGQDALLARIEELSRRMDSTDQKLALLLERMPLPASAPARPGAD